jgi:hypothetical protein
MTASTPMVVTGRAPVDEEAARGEIALAFTRALSLSDDRRTVPSVEGGAELASYLKEAQERHAALRHPDGTIVIDEIEFIDEEQAVVVFTLTLEGVSSEARRGQVLAIDGHWKVARSTFGELMGIAGVNCPPTTS